MSYLHYFKQLKYFFFTLNNNKKKIIRFFNKTKFICSYVFQSKILVIYNSY